MNVTEWLLDSDPAIRWQVLGDLTGGRDDVVGVERARVATEGWGAQLLARQKPDGGWSDTSNPQSWIETPDGSATDALLLLRAMGVDPTSDEARRSVVLVKDNVTHYEGNQPFFSGETEPCINGMVLAVGAYFGEPSEELLERLLDEQLDDGGWNCDAPSSQRSSFHSTICVLEGMLEFEDQQGSIAAVTAARSRGQEYLLERHMFRSLSSGDVIDPEWGMFSFPTGWHYDVLRGLDYLRSADVEPDDRIAEAIELVQKARGDDGRWSLQNQHAGQTRFDMNERTGEPSRWITLHALRVMTWAGIDW